MFDIGYLIFASILGIPCGVGIALYITSNLLDKSNNFGDSKGNVTTFSKEGIIGRNFKDRVSRNTRPDPLMNPVIREHDAEKSANS